MIRINNVINYYYYYYYYYYWRLQDLILLFKIPMRTRQDFFEIYRQFGPTAWKSFASPDLWLPEDGINRCRNASQWKIVCDLVYTV